MTIALKVVFFRVQSDFDPTNWVELPIHTYSLVSIVYTYSFVSINPTKPGSNVPTLR